MFVSVSATDNAASAPCCARWASPCAVCARRCPTANVTATATSRTAAVVLNAAMAGLRRPQRRRRSCQRMRRALIGRSSRNRCRSFRQSDGCLVAVAWSDRCSLLDDGVQVDGNGWVDRPGSRRRRFCSSPDHQTVSRFGACGSQCQQLEQRESQAAGVTARIRLSAELFRGHVTQRSHQIPGSSDIFVIFMPCQSKVRNPNAVFLIKQQVGRFYVAVQNTMLMCITKG